MHHFCSHLSDQLQLLRQVWPIPQKQNFQCPVVSLCGSQSNQDRIRQVQPVLRPWECWVLAMCVQFWLALHVFGRNRHIFQCQLRLESPRVADDDGLKGKVFRGRYKRENEKTHVALWILDLTHTRCLTAQVCIYCKFCFKRKQWNRNSSFLIAVYCCALCN